VRAVVTRFSAAGVCSPRSYPPSFRLSARLSTRLFAHQREGVAWLWARHCLGQGGILGDDMARTGPQPGVLAPTLTV